MRSCVAAGLVELSLILMHVIHVHRLSLKVSVKLVPCIQEAGTQFDHPQQLRSKAQNYPKHKTAEC